MTNSEILLSGYLIVAFFIGLFHRVRLKDGMTVSLFTINDRQTGFFALTATIFSTFAGGGLVFGYMELGYRIGVGAIYIALSFFVGLLFAATIAPRIREAGETRNWYEFTDFLVTQVGSRLRAPVSVVNILIFFAIMAAQLVAMGRIIELMLDINFYVSLGAVTLVVYLYTAIAGLGGVYKTDLFQAVIVFVVTWIILGPLAFSNTSFEALKELPTGMITGETAGLTLIIGALVFVAPSLIVRSDSWQRILSAKNPKVARQSFIAAGILIIPMYLIFPILGMIARAELGEVTDTLTVPFEFLKVTFESLPWTYPIILVSLFAVLMSSCDSYLQLVSVILSRLKDKKRWENFEGSKKDSNTKSKVEREILRNLLIIMGLLILVGFVIAALLPSIVDLMIVALSIVLVFLPVASHALIKGNGNESAALISIYSGLLVFTITFLIAVSNVWGRTEQAFVFGVLVSFVSYFSVLLIKKKKHKTKNE